MTTSGIHELFTFARSGSRKNGSVSITTGWKMACGLLVLCAATAILSPAQTVRTLVNFHWSSGMYPQGPLVQGTDGNLYGTTSNGGANGGGTVFKMSPSGLLTTLYSFCAQPRCIDGNSPWAGVVQATDGNFYGTTANGGIHSYACGVGGCGTIFKITPGGTLTTLYSFCAQAGCTDGIFPDALVRATDGNFYGTTWAAGRSAGTVFKITPGGVLTTLHIFCPFSPCTDGYYPFGLMQAADGNFYGETWYGGLFKITPGGTLTTFYTFCPNDKCPDNDLVFPTALVQATDGNFYGTTVGSTGGYGTVFRITPSGELTKLHSFCAEADCADGYNPYGLVQATDGNFYGATHQGGDTQCNPPDGCGTVFRITPGGTLTTLHDSHEFCDTRNAGCPTWPSPPGLVQATSGTFYGITLVGGAYGRGTVFSLCVGLGWFTEELPNYGKVGDTIKILGTNLTGASSVTFNGIAAAFTVVSPTLIQATVPLGATTGYVRVTLPSGRIPSNKKFRVTPQITSFTPASGPAGTLVTITGVSLTQTWEVTIHGVHASFTVVDDGTVTATVPTGATTGTIRVAGPGGAATSTTNFTVN